ncbi:MAG: hypothetical protein GOV01_00600, partial [Candidatus Altiarchaeota archaeon]|nr:hypothetical protein [Candidatus Altiarchaeota archaeon]
MGRSMFGLLMGVLVFTFLVGYMFVNVLKVGEIASQVSGGAITIVANMEEANALVVNCEEFEKKLFLKDAY